MTDRVVVVGASLAGLRAVESLETLGHTGEIVVVGKEAAMPYNRPPLSKAALSLGFDDASLTFRLRSEHANVSWRLGEEAVALDLEGSSIDLASGETIEFDKLLVATGIEPRTLSTPAPLAGRHVVRTLDDARSLRGRLRPGVTVLVVGAGVLGCELAASARLAGADVVIVAPEQLPMQMALGAEFAAEIERRHQVMGIEFIMSAMVERYEDDDGRTGVELTNGARLTVDVVVEAVGSTPNVDWLEGNGLDLSNGVLCDNTMRAEPTRRVFAAGDVARFPNPLFDDVPRRIEHWSVPTETARRAAAGMTTPDGELPTFAPLPSFWSDQFDWRIQAFGMPVLGTGDVRVLDGRVGQGEFVLGYHREGRLVGVAGTGRAVNAHRKPLLAALQSAQVA